MPSLEVLACALAVVIAAYVVFGVAGFGSTLVAIPLLVHFFPFKFVIPVMVLIDCIASINQGVKLRADVKKTELYVLIPFMLAGMVLGVTLLIRLPGSLLMLLLGLLVIVFGANYLVRYASVLRFKRWVVVPAGLFAGTLSALFSIGGPIYVMYLSGRGATTDEIRATMPVVFIFTTFARIALYAATGLFNREVFVLAALLLPAMVVGLWLGNRLHGRLTRKQAIRIIGGLLVVSGVSLLLRAL